jgi:hypothetical protein
MPTAFALIATLLAVHASPVPASPPDTDAFCPCPLHAHTAILFEDGSRRTPDFWHEDSLAVQEIIVCSRGISFIFPGHDGGNLFLSVLVFPNPHGDVWQGDSGWLSTPARRVSDEERFQTLLDGLSRVAGQALDAGARFDFGAPGSGEPPMLVDPSRGLRLRWKGDVVPLRGYLDVYLSVVL